MNIFCESCFLVKGYINLLQLNFHMHDNLSLIGMNYNTRNKLSLMRLNYPIRDKKN